MLGDEELAVARLQQGTRPAPGWRPTASRTGSWRSRSAGLDNYALVLGRPLEATNDILGSLWLVLVLFGATGVVLAGAVGDAVARPACGPYASCPRRSSTSRRPTT